MDFMSNQEVTTLELCRRSHWFKFTIKPSNRGEVSSKPKQQTNLQTRFWPTAKSDNSKSQKSTNIINRF